MPQAVAPKKLFRKSFATSAQPHLSGVHARFARKQRKRLSKSWSRIASSLSFAALGLTAGISLTNNQSPEGE